MSKKQVLRGVILILPLTMLLSGVFVLDTKAAQDNNAPTFGQKVYAGQGPAIDVAAWKEKVKNEYLPMLSGNVAEIVARNLGVTAIHGKKLRESKPGATRTRPYAFNVPVGTDDWAYENEPSVAISPTNDRYVFAFHHWSSGATNYCTIRVSMDGGTTFWDYPYNLGYVNAATDTFADPVVRWSPDGYYAIASYMAIDNDTVTGDILCYAMYAQYGGFYMTGPISVWPDMGYRLPDKPWVDVHRYDPNYGWRVYCTCTLFDPSWTRIVVTASDNWGFNWPFWAWNLAQNGVDVNQGSRPIGLKGSPQSVIAWYNSGTDGWLTGKFNIKTAVLPDGMNYAPLAPVNAAANVTYECPYYLGPSGKYHRWWGSMFPAIDIGPDNRIFIAFTLDPATTVTSAEDGDVYITYSTNASYTSWLTRKKVGYGGTAAQGYPTIVTQKQSNGGYKVYLAWMNHDAVSKNLYYDIYRMVSVNKGGAWGSKKKVNDYRSISDYSFLGDYIDSAAHMRRPLVIWTDRSDKTSISDYEDDVLLDRLDK